MMRKSESDLPNHGKVEFLNQTRTSNAGVVASSDATAKFWVWAPSLPNKRLQIYENPNGRGCLFPFFLTLTCI